MFCFKLWSKFAAFRDPLTITQNLTFPIPPKTTVGGIMAAILGIDYNDYFNDPNYFDFKYSLVLKKPVRKKSFAQNYVIDYTKKAEVKVSKIGNYYKARAKYRDLKDLKGFIMNKDNPTKKEEKTLSTIDSKIDTAEKKTIKDFDRCEEVLTGKFVLPKPISRELIIEPQYLIFIDEFKYEDKIIDYLKSHLSEFALYMGNSEFAANYEYLDSSGEAIDARTINSFTSQPESILFEPGKRYTNLYMATKTVGGREYREYKNIVISDTGLNLNKSVKTTSIETTEGTFNCEFI